MFRVRFTLIGVCDTSTVDDDIRAVDCTEIDDFISICNVQFIKICVQCFNLHWIKHIIQGASNLSAGTCNPYF